MRTTVLDEASADLFTSLIPDVTVTEVARTPAGLLLTALALGLSASCPHCGTVSTRVHSSYTRQPHDLPSCGLPVRLLLHVRRFRCLPPACPAATFTERLPTLVAPAAQRTIRVNEALRALALAFSSEAGARQSAQNAMPVSSDTLLRRAHTTSLPTHPTPRVLGIDDFSFRKGQVFGTILTDGESHAVVDLLPDRTSETAAAWFQKHPGVEIVTRDRSADDRRAVRSGAPNAIQVADRFHYRHVQHDPTFYERYSKTFPVLLITVPTTARLQRWHAGWKERWPAGNWLITTEANLPRDQWLEFNTGQERLRTFADGWQPGEDGRKSNTSHTPGAASTANNEPKKRKVISLDWALKDL